MDIHIDFWYLVISTILWFYALDCISSAYIQIERTTTNVEMTNKKKAQDFIYHLARIFFFGTMYLMGGLTASNMLVLRYFIIFVVVHHIVRILLLFRTYPDNIKSYSMSEIYVNMIIYMCTVFWMGYLWVL